MRHLLALDAGTSSARAIIFDEFGVQLSAISREWTHVSIPKYPGSMSFDMDKNWKLLCDCIKEASSRVHNLNIVAISTTSMREGIAIYDENDKELWACANVDSRAIKQVKKLKSTNKDLEQEIYRKSGQTFALSAIPRLLWLKENEPLIYQKASSVVMLSDWISHRLGANLTIDPSNGGTTGLFNLKTRKWDYEIATLCGIKDSFLSATVCEAGDIIGEVSKSCSKQSGLKTGIPIVMGGGDAQLGTVGVGAVHEGEVTVFGGSFWQQEVNLSSVLYDDSGQIRMNFHALPNLWQAEAITFFPGIIVQWFRDVFCPDIKEKALISKKDTYDILSDMASHAPVGSNFILPIFSDAMNYSHWKHAAPSFLNLSLDTNRCNRATIFRSLLENSAIVTLSNLERIAKLTGSFPKEIIFAGGASKSELWCQIVADVLQIRVKTRVVKEATSLGAAMFASYGVGLIKDIENEGIKYVKEDKVYYPNEINKNIYLELYAKWKKAYKVQMDLADQNITTSMWRAPGE